MRLQPHRLHCRLNRGPRWVSRSPRRRLCGQVVCRHDAGSSFTRAVMKGVWQVYTHSTREVAKRGNWVGANLLLRFTRTRPRHVRWQDCGSLTRVSIMFLILHTHLQLFPA